MIEGVWAALPDLWNRAEADLLERAVERLLARGVDGFFAPGTTGLGAELSVRRRMQVLERLVRAINAAGERQQQKMVAAISANAAEDVHTLLEHAGSLGVKGVALTPPSYGMWTHADLLAWLDAALDGRQDGKQSNLEIYLYHIPAAVRTGWDPDLLTTIDQRFNIEGIKDSSGDVARLAAYLAWGRRRGRPFSLMVGNERLTSYGLMLGASGVVSAFACAYPDLMIKICTACRQKDWDAVAALQNEINAKLDLLAHTPQREVPAVLLNLAREQEIF
ncbi:MAG: dihydrodipicolinate synthase family protein [Ktedonobacteraceae bacterium]|nr:dihydrodipicolinate synthase family protein [Ktedonobacteraceae bacterium]